MVGLDPNVVQHFIATGFLQRALLHYALQVRFLILKILPGGVIYCLHVLQVMVAIGKPIFQQEIYSHRYLERCFSQNQ